MPTRSKQSDENKSQFWKNHLNAWSQTGTKQALYCREHQLSPRQFTYWKNKFKYQNLPVELVQVSPAQVNEIVGAQKQILRLDIKSGFQIEIPDDFSQSTLARVLQVVVHF